MRYVKLMRPKHYIKNLLIFLPLFFSGTLFSPRSFLTVFLSFIVFCLTSSCIYILNDIKDKEKDSKHPTKCKRPIASGNVSVCNAIILLFLLLVINIAITLLLHLPSLTIFLLVLYFLINILYSFILKNIPIVDVFIVVCGFVIRVLFGASLFDIEVSNWFYLTIFSISFYLALGKRRNELSLNKTKSREVLKYYNQSFLDKNMYMFLAMAIVFYSLWATDSTMVKMSNNLLIWTVPVVMLICMKYSLNVEKGTDGDPTNIILSDKILMLLGTLLLIMLLLILYF